MKLPSEEDFTGEFPIPPPDHTNDLYRDLVEHSHDLLCNHDLAGNLLSVNPTPARLLGYEVDELLHTPMRNLIAPEYRDQFDDYLIAIKRDGIAKGYLSLVTKSGERRIWEYHNTLRTEGLSSPVVRGIAHDVTEQKRAETALRQATEQHRQIITGVGHGLIMLDRKLRCVVWNRYMEELTLLSFEQVWGRDLLELLPQFQDGGVHALLEQSLAGKSVTMPDIAVRSPRGDGKWFTSELSPLFGSTGENNGTIIALHDVTDRRKAEEALRQSEARFRVALKCSPITVFNQDRDLRYTWMHNPRVGQAGQAAVGKTTAEMFIEEDAAGISAMKRRVLDTGHGAREQVELTLEGKKHWVDLTVEPLLGADGQVEGIACASVDVTESRARTNLLEMLLEINRALASKRELPELLTTIASCIRSVFQHEITAVSLYEAEARMMRISAVETLADSNLSVSNMAVPESECVSALAFHSGATELFEHSDLAAIASGVARRSLDAGIRSLVCVPLKNRQGPFGVLSLGTRKDHDFDGHQVELLEQIAGVVAIALDNARAYNEIAHLRDKLQQEKIYLEGEIRAAFHFEEIVGESPALAQVLRQAQRVAASDATVLILGVRAQVRSLSPAASIA